MSTLTSRDAMDISETRQIVRAGLLGGLVGGVTIWIYEGSARVDKQARLANKNTILAI